MPGHLSREGTFHPGPVGVCPHGCSHRSKGIRGATTRRGYGAAHQKLRAQLAPLVAAGGVTCNRCGKRIEPGEPWDLGHTHDRTGYTGPEHARCNRAGRAGGVDEQRT